MNCSNSDFARYHDPALLEVIIEDIRIGWKQSDGAPFFHHFLK